MGSRFFSKVQFSKEGTRGQAVAADTLVLGRIPAVGTDRTPVFPREDVGVNAPAVRAVIHQYLYSNTLSIEHGYFQALPWILGCGLKGGVSASEANVGQGDYEWNLTPSLSAANSPDSVTIELGDDTQAFETEYAMFERIRLSWTVAQGQDASPVGIEADFFGRQLTPTSFTSGISIPTVEPLNGKLSRMYVNSAWADVGTTEKTNILRGADIEILTGVHPKFAGSANKYFNSYGEGLIEVTANVTLEGNSDADAIFDAQQAGTFQVLRFAINGGQIGSGDNHILTVDIGGYWESVSPLGSEDRNDNLHSGVFRGVAVDVSGTMKMLAVNVTTNVSAY